MNFSDYVLIVLLVKILFLEEKILRLLEKSQPFFQWILSHKDKMIVDNNNDNVIMWGKKSLKSCSKNSLF